MSLNVVLKSIWDDRGIAKAQKSIAALGGTVGRVGGVLAAAFSVRAITNFAGDALKAADAANVANLRLDSIAKSMNLFGIETSIVTSRLKSFADQQMFIIGQDDELIKSTQAKLLTFKNLALTADEAGGAFDRATIAAFDLAAAGFGSAETNALQLGKALQDPIKGLTALRRAGVTFTESEKARIKQLVESNKMLEAQDLILTAIEQQVGGTAAATATSSLKMTVALGEVTEQIGQYLLPAFEDIATTGVDAIQQMLDPTTELGTEFAETATAAGIFFQQIADGFASFSENGGFKVVLDFLEAVFVGFAQIGFMIDDANDRLGKFLSGDFEGYVNSLGTFYTRYNKFVQDIYDEIDGRARNSAAIAQNSGEANRFKNLYNQSLSGGSGAGGGGGGAKSAAQLQAEQFAKVQKVIKAAQANILKAEQAYTRAKFEINRESNARIEALNTAALKAQEELIEQSQMRITDAFRSATELRLSDLFTSETTRELTTQVKKLTQNLTVSVTKETEKVAYKSVTDIINGLRDRLTASKNLLSNASRLAGLGFKQTFIEQVLETGTETGNALAGAILEASPETQSELKSLFGELEDVSETGAESLAKNIYDKFELATREMAKQSKDIQTELDLALEAENAILLQNLADAALAFQSQVSDIKTQFLLDIGEFDGAFAGLGNTIDALIAKFERLMGVGSGDIKAALTAPGSGSVVAGASVTEGVSIKNLQNATGIIVDELSDVKGTAAYLQARINAANSFIKLASSNAMQDASAAASIANWTQQLVNLQGAAATGNVAGTVVNINVRTDTTQSQAMVGKTIGNIVTKYVTTGGQVIVSGN
jgi:hypothetical protein